MISIFRTNHPAVLVTLLVYTLVLKGVYFWLPAWVAPSPDSFLGFPFTKLISDLQVAPWALQVIDVLFIYLQAIFFNAILINFGLFERNTYVPALCFITATSLFGIWSAADLQTISQLFLLFSLYNLFMLSGKEISKENIFYTAMYLSIGSLFYFPVALFLLIILGTLIIRGYSTGDTLLALIGFILPYYFIGMGYYFYDRFDEYIVFLQKILFHRPGISFTFDWIEFAWFGFIMALSVIGFLMFMGDSDFRIVKQRRMIFIAAAFMLLVLLGLPLVGGSDLVYMQVMVPAIAMFTAKVFDRARLGKLFHLLFYVLFLGTLAFELYFLHVI